MWISWRHHAPGTPPPRLCAAQVRIASPAAAASIAAALTTIADAESEGGTPTGLHAQQQLSGSADGSSALLVQPLQNCGSGSLASPLAQWQ